MPQETGAPEVIEIQPNELRQIILMELEEYFSDDPSGRVLLEHEALHIAGGIVERAILGRMRQRNLESSP